jgi:DNA polymerase III epsilon subunit-like protein
MSSSGPDERLVFVDLETGGLETWRPIIQIAAIAVTSSLRELEVFESKLTFDSRFVDPRSLRKNNYSPDRWRREARPAREVATAFAEFLRRHATVDVSAAGRGGFQVAQLVAHNAAFDGPFLQAWFERLGQFFPGHFRLLCTVQRAVWLFHEDKKLTPPRDFKLGTLCEYFGVPLRTEDAHDALNDARATVGLYREMVRFQSTPRIAA